MFALKLTIAVFAAAIAFVWILDVGLSAACSKNGEIDGRPTRVVDSICYIEVEHDRWEDWSRWKRAQGGRP